MRAVAVIAGRELLSYFGTPLAYVFIVIFLVFAAGLTFYFGDFLDRGVADLRPFFLYHPWLYLLLMPAVGMRLWAEERKTGTLEYLMTLPVTVTQAVLGKFLAAWTFAGAALALTAPIWLTVNYLGQPDNGVILASYAGSWLMAGAFLALSACMSAVTGNQVVAFVLAAALCFVMMMTGFELVRAAFAGWAPDWLAATVVELSILNNFRAVADGVVDLRNVIYFVSLIGTCLVINAAIVETGRAGQGMTGRPFANSRLSALLGCGLAVVAFVALNIWADRSLRTARLDLTEDGLYTIADGTRSVLRSIREPIRLRFYANERLDDLGPDYVALRKRAVELLEDYARISGGLLRIEHIDPKPFSPEEDRAVADGVDAIPDVLDRTQYFLGLAGANSTDGHYVIPHLAPERAAFLEYDLTRMIHDLATPTKTAVALLGDLPLHGDRVRQAAPWAVLDAVERFFEVRPLSGPVERVDDDIDIVWLAEPGALDEATLYALDQFVMRGGRVLAFLDPHPEILAAARRGPNPPPPRVGSLESLAPLLAAWGVDIPSRTVVGDRPGAMQVQLRKDGRAIVTDYLVWFMLGEQAFAADDLVTGNLKRMQFRSAGHIEARGDGVRIEPLVQSTAAASEIDLSRVEFAPDPTGILADFTPAGRRFVIAARIGGSIGSAFPDGPPESIVGDEARRAHKSTPESPPALIVVADSDVLSDRAWVERQNFLGQSLAVPYANNGDFVVNALDHLSGSPALIGLRGRGIADRGFAVLEAMAQQAEQQYRATERALRDGIAGLQDRIAELRKAEQAQGVVLTEEQQAEIDRSRGEMLDLRRELRDVQFALHKDVGDLKARITALNMWAVPAMIGLLALLIAGWRWWRNRRYREAGR